VQSANGEKLQAHKIRISEYCFLFHSTECPI
jgi:hypothetical protein